MLPENRAGYLIRKRAVDGVRDRGSFSGIRNATKDFVGLEDFMDCHADRVRRDIR